MLNFAYASNLNPRAVAEWCQKHGQALPSLKGGRPALLADYRFCFSNYSEYWGGGSADVVRDPGKSVTGVIYDLSDAELAVLDQKDGRKLEGGREVGKYKRIDITVLPIGSTEPVKAITYQCAAPEKTHVPPSRRYLELIVQGAYSQGLPMLWIGQIQSFSVVDDSASA